MVILADTSAWIEYLRQTGSGINTAVREHIEAGQVATTDAVIFEVMAGARRERVEDHRRLLDACEYLPQRTRDDALRAAELYRTCRQQGVTIRSLNDCMIAAVAIRCHVPLLHADVDFLRLASVTDLELVPSS